ncbi:hypothetical protein MSG28_010416 [Choristoneura fumiferana]|uniref:Uncharacterized protein n=2 Tax=Choristoneura fumiferana TaxID=7141 RepID=A0ACC0KL55_CHOFU|nr:hypothetical protein MSG28_010416 [Choristoneura fumiferana]KAI8437033.1 hypothetical protein MSG28_010416 [Choristoneura fumiferana]
MCIDYVLPKSGMYENHTVKYFVILETPEMYETDIGFVASALLISCVFLVIVLIVYALLPELRNLCGLILMSYVASLFGGFLMLATLQLMIKHGDVHRFMLYLKLSVIMGVSWVLEVVSFLAPQFSVWYLTDAYNLLIGVSIFLIFICKKKIYNKLRKRYSRSKLIYLYGPIVILCIANMVFNEMFQISQSDSGDLRTIGNRDVKNWKEYQQQRGSLDTVRTSICCDSDNIRTTKTSSF